MVAENTPKVRLRLVSQSLAHRLMMTIVDVFHVPDLRHSTATPTHHTALVYLTRKKDFQ